MPLCVIGRRPATHAPRASTARPFGLTRLPHHVHVCCFWHRLLRRGAAGSCGPARAERKPIASPERGILLAGARIAR
jgi:hypothetical protein